MKIDDLSSTPSLSQAKFLTRSSFIVSLKKFSPLHWNNFVLAYTPTITFWIRRKNIPPKYEDDILQDTFRSVCIGIDRFDFDADRGSFRGWLRTITERRVADCLRKIPSEEEMPPQNLALLPSPAQKTDIEIAARQRAENEVKARALELVRQSTTEKTWQMFWDSTIEGVPTAEIAKQFGVTSAAVRVAKQRVKKRLKDLMIGESELP